MKIYSRNVVFLCALTSAAWQSVGFAKPKTMAPSSSLTAPKIDFMRVTERTPTPAALTLAEKKIRVDALLKTMPNAPVVNLEKAEKPISMDVRHPMVEGQAFLEFNSPDSVSPYNNSAIVEPTKDSLPYIATYFKPSGDGTYLFDFNLSNLQMNQTPQLTFAQAMFTNIQQQTVAAGDAHVLFFATIKDAGTGWLPMTLQSNCLTKFYGVEITKVK